MDRKKLVLLLGALVVAIGSAFLARSMFAGDSAPAAQAAVEPTGPKVLVANRALPVGTIITADAMGYQNWPEELVKDAYFIDGEADMSQLLGTVVRFPITAGEPVTQGSLVSPGDRGFLAAALGPGMRAVTVPVSAQSGVGGFIFPGDRVDMVLTQTIDGEGRPLKAAETLQRNLRVLATDQQTEQVTDEEGRVVVRAFRTITLEVTPKIGEQIALAQTLGDVTFVLRSIADNGVDLERAIARGDIVIPEDATPEEEERILREAMVAPVVERSSVSTGGDISRFQRSTMPAQRNSGGGGEDRTPAAPGRSATENGAPVYTGPTVRVTRGEATTEVPVGYGSSTSTAPGAGEVERLGPAGAGVR